MCDHEFRQVGPLTWNCTKCTMSFGATYMVLEFQSQVFALKRELAKGEGNPDCAVLQPPAGG